MSHFTLSDLCIKIKDYFDSPLSHKDDLWEHNEEEHEYEDPQVEDEQPLEEDKVCRHA